MKIHGLVQGVNFRRSTQAKALELGIAGQVQNNADGTVSVVAQGEEEQLQQLMGWAYQGPAAARVDDVEVGWKQLQEVNYDEFSILR